MARDYEFENLKFAKHLFGKQLPRINLIRCKLVLWHNINMVHITFLKHIINLRSYYDLSHKHTQLGILMCMCVPGPVEQRSLARNYTLAPSTSTVA